MRGLRTAPASSASTICASEEEENREKCCVERRIKNCKRPHILSIPLFLELQELHETQELEGCQRRYTSTSTRRTVQSMPTTTNDIIAIILALSDTSSLPIAPKKNRGGKTRTDPQRYIPWETERQRRKSEHPPLLPELAREAPDIPEIETKSPRELQFPWQQISHARRGGDQGRPERERAPCCRAWCPTHPCHYYSHYQSSKLSNRTPQIAPPLITFHISESAILFLPSNATNFQDQIPNTEMSKPNIDRSQIAGITSASKGNLQRATSTKP